ncbi:gtp-binding protein [Phytophthora cinnamomi]|uniref:gtp-binding protein n=1 Tax=Phytophthora cinnamomi TaxID=4785 RepID=UPI003559AB20|nr:gtp-binding protein [Phytophthora cinnamomi]
MDELKSVGVGVALGLVLISFLAFYPGEPFDYTADDTCTSDRPPPAPKNEPESSSPAAEPIISTSLDPQKQRQIAEIEKAAQRVKVQKLQELLGLEKEKAQLLVQRAKQQALDAVETPAGNYTVGSSKSAWLDRAFLAIMFGLLVWVLWQDYSINLFSVAAHMLPREAEVVRQVIAVPRDLLAQVLALWG